MFLRTCYYVDENFNMTFGYSLMPGNPNPQFSVPGIYGSHDNDIKLSMPLTKFSNDNDALS